MELEILGFIIVVLMVIGVSNRKIDFSGLDIGNQFYKFFKARNMDGNGSDVNLVQAILEVAKSGKEIAQAIRNHTVYLSTTGKKDQ